MARRTCLIEKKHLESNAHIKWKRTNKLNLHKIDFTGKMEFDMSAWIPEIVGDWWQIAGNPDLGRYQTDRQQPLDFGIWQAADGTWQLWSCEKLGFFIDGRERD